MSDPPPVTAAVLVIGNEVLSGRTQDLNLNYLAKRLTAAGIRLMEARVIGDDARAIVAALDALRATHTYVFTTGGIGPTHDDITAAAVAEAFGVKLKRDPRAVALLERHYAPGDLNEARLKMADIPEGAELIANPVSRAPGFRIGNVYVLAGVPRIMQAMLDGVLPELRGGPPMVARAVTCRLPEGVIAAELGLLQARHPGVEIGSYPFMRIGQFGVTLVIRGTDAAACERAAEELKAMIHRLGGEPEDGDHA